PHRCGLWTHDLTQPATPVGLRSHARVLRVAGDADPERPARRAGARLLAAKLGVPAELERPGQGPGVVAAVVDLTRRRAEGVRVGRDQVAPTDLHRVESEPLGDEVEG